MTEQVSLKKEKVSSTVPFVSGWKPDTEETSKQKKLKQPWKRQVQWIKTLSLVLTT